MLIRGKAATSAAIHWQEMHFGYWQTAPLPVPPSTMRESLFLTKSIVFKTL